MQTPHYPNSFDDQACVEKAFGEAAGIKSLSSYLLPPRGTQCCKFLLLEADLG